MLTLSLFLLTCLTLLGCEEKNIPEVEVTPKETAEMTIPSADSDAWNIAKGSRQGRPSMIRYRPSLSAFVGDARYPRRLVFTWTYETDLDNGLPTEEQSANMKRFEDSLIRAFDPDRGAVLAFVLTNAGQRHWHFYTAEPDDLGERVNAALSYSDERLPIDIEIEDDPEWQEMSQVLNITK